MKHQGGRPIDLHEAAKVLRAKDLCGVERYFREKDCPEFEYDGELDVFRFTEDGGFAFCREFGQIGLAPPLLPAARAAGGASTRGLE